MPCVVILIPEHSFCNTVCVCMVMQISSLLLLQELKQQRRWRLRKRHLKSEFALLQTLSRLFHLVYFSKCWQMFLELSSKGLYQSSGKEKLTKLLSCVVRPRQNVNLGTFTRYGRACMQWWPRNVQNSVMHVQSCCFVNLNLLLFCRSLCRCLRRWLSSLLTLTSHLGQNEVWYRQTIFSPLV